VEIALTWKEFRYLVHDPPRSPNRFLESDEDYTSLPEFYTKLAQVLCPEDFALVLGYNVARRNQAHPLAKLVPREVIQGDRVRV
jgi:predicted methyltransferase